MRQASPFPYERLPRFSRAELLELRRSARIISPDRLSVVAKSATEWLGAPVKVTPSPPLVQPAPGHTVDAVCAAIIELPSSAPVVIDIEPRLATIVIDRVLGGTGEHLPPHPGALTDVERGILAYVIARVLALAAPGALRLAGIVSSSAALAMVLDEDPLVCWPARVQIGGEVGLLRVWLKQRTLSDASPSRDVGPLAIVLPKLSVPVWVEAGRAFLSASDASTLEVGDIVLLDEALTNHELNGEVLLRACARAGPAWRCTIEGGRLVVQTSVPARRMSHVTKERSTSMNDEERDHAAEVLQSMGDAPIELSVELARFEMPLSELAALRPGEVLSTGRAIGERVVLRAGDRSIANGELVEVDGEIGVRLLVLGSG